MGKIDVFFFLHKDRKYLMYDTCTIYKTGQILAKLSDFVRESGEFLPLFISLLLSPAVNLAALTFDPV